MIRIEGGEIQFDHIQRRFIRQAKEILKLNTINLQRYIRQEKMTGGTTESRLKVRTGRLRASVCVKLPEIKEHQIESNITIGTVYARTHIGPVGQVTTIRPREKQYLTIPLSAVQTKAGVTRGTAKSFMGEMGEYGNTFIARSKAGNLLIFGQKRIMKGARQGQLRAKIIPLFLLVKQVRIKTRIHPEQLLDWIRPKLIQDFINKGIPVA